MSHRVTTQTEIKDKTLAIQAIKGAKLQYREVGNDQLVITSGGMNNATIDLRTGVISGDSDYGHDKENLGVLRQHYSEAKFRAESLKNGVSIESRVVEKNGDVVLMWATG
jgi:hypothetical protein